MKEMLVCKILIISIVRNKERQWERLMETMENSNLFRGIDKVMK